MSKSAFLPVIETACHLSVLRREVFALKKKKKKRNFEELDINLKGGKLGILAKLEK